MSTLRTAGLELANFLLTTKEGRELVGKGKDYAVRGIKKTGEALRVHVFGESRKLLSVSGGQYKMSDNV